LGQLQKGANKKKQNEGPKKDSYSKICKFSQENDININIRQFQNSTALVKTKYQSLTLKKHST
jgi:hypothetical protein